MSSRRPTALVSALLLGVLSSACGSDDDAGGSRAFELPADGLGPACHPMRTAGACSVPFPSSYYLAVDSSSPTGFRVALESEAVPAGSDLAGGDAPAPFEPARWNEFDGFSPATPIIAYFEEKLDVGSLPPQTDFDASLSPQSATLIVDMETGELFPHFAELDISADISPSDRQALLIRTAQHLRPSHRYGVAVTKALRALDGTTPAASPGFASAVKGARSDDPRVAAELARLDETLAAFESAGVDRSDLLLAWDFRTASVDAMTRNVLTMRDSALEAAGPDGIGYDITHVEVDRWSNVHKWLRGTFTVPSFLSHDDKSKDEIELVRGSDGLPAIQSNAEYVFELIIPNSALTEGPLPLLVFGHGLLGAPLDGVAGSLRRFCDEKKYVCIGTEFIGLTAAEEGQIDPYTGLAGNASALAAIKNVNALWWVSDRLQQAHVNQMVMARTAKRILADAQAFVDPGGGAPPFSALIDPFEVYYYGISQGGIFGASHMAYSPDIERGVLHVGGSGFSLFVQRSVNWNAFFPGIRNGYPDRLDQQLIIALWQPAFDLAEGAGTAWAQGEHDPLPGSSSKNLLFTFAAGDSQVPNLGSDIQARTLGLPLLAPSAVDVWGLGTTDGGVDSAAVYFDLGRQSPPETNETPLGDNDVHSDVRLVPAHMEMADRFLRTGKVDNTCGGPCAFPGFEP